MTLTKKDDKENFYLMFDKQHSALFEKNDIYFCLFETLSLF